MPVSSLAYGVRSRSALPLAGVEGAPATASLPGGAWGLLLLSLRLTLGSHYASCGACDEYLRDFDHAYATDTECTAENPATKLSRWLDVGGAMVFVAGVALPAIFAFANVRFAPPSQPLPPTTESPSVREKAGPAPAAPAAPALRTPSPGAGGARR